MHSLETIVAWAKRKGFVYPNSDIYGGLANMRDYGPYGSLLRKNIYDLRVKTFVTSRDDMVLMDTTILAHPTTWIASGHVGGFSDALIDDRKTGQRFRADKIIEAYIEEIQKKSLTPVIVVDCIHTTIQKIDQSDVGLNIVPENLTPNTELLTYIQSLPFKKVYITNAPADIITQVLHGYLDNSEVFSLENAPSKTDPDYFKQLCKHLRLAPTHLVYFDHNQSNLDAAHSAGLSQTHIYTSNTETIARLDTKKKAYMSLENYVEHIYGFTNLSPEARGNEGMYRFIVGEKLKNSSTNKEADWTDVRQFNLMLNTHLGPVADEANKVYMRPETCQSLFTDFKNVLDTTRMRIPFGLAQIGKAFRNEITPGQFLFRTREFEQMEIEYFVPADADVAMDIFHEWKEESMRYRTQVVGIPADMVRFKDHDKLAHYAAAATDIEFLFPRGFGEVQGIHNRTNFDLTQHQEYSKVSMQYSDPKTGERYIPRCVETSAGIGRQFMAVLFAFYAEESVGTSACGVQGDKNSNVQGDNNSNVQGDNNSNVQANTRIVMRFPYDLAPIKYAIMPLVEKDENMVILAKKISKKLKMAGISTEYDAGGNIGKRYRRQDEIGTPYCVCVDGQSLEDGTVTIRDRDTMEQVRVQWDKVGQ